MDDPCHAIFHCQKYNDERVEMNRMLGKTIGPEDVEAILCGEGNLRLLSNLALRRNVTREAESRRSEFTKMVTEIMKAKEADERAQQEEEGTGRNTRRPWRRQRR